MSFFWFIIVVVLVIFLLRQKNTLGDKYKQGYWDGYRALGDKVQQLLDSPQFDQDALRSAVGVGHTGVEAESLVKQVPASSVVSPGAIVPDQSSTAMQQQTVSSPDPAAVRSLRNLNAVLYMASFLLVAAGALFVAAAMSAIVKLVGVWVIIAIFYGTGYVLHRRVARLRPASIAFLGAGLALIPFAGLALYQYTSLSVDAAWLLTSLIGVIIYMFTAIRLQSQLVSYLAMAFVLSLVAAGPASVSLGIVWQFVALMIVALAASSIAIMKPPLVPAIFARPIEDMGQVVTPLVLVASLFVGDSLKLVGYEVVFSVATMYYIVVFLQSRSPLHESVLRIVASVAAMLFAYDLAEDNFTAVGISLLILTIVQVVYSLWRAKMANHYIVQRCWICALFIVQAISFSWWQQDMQVQALNTIGLIVVGMTSLSAMLRFRQAWFGLVGVLASYLLPFIVARDLIDPALPMMVPSAWFVVAMALSLVGLQVWKRRSVAVRVLLTAAYVGYIALGLYAALSYGSLGFTTIILAIFAALLTIAAYGLGQVRALVFAGFFLFATLGCSWAYFDFNSDWALFGVAWIAALLLYGGSWISHALHPRTTLHRLVLVVLGAGGLGLAGVVRLGDSDATMATFGALSLLVMAVMIAIEGYRSKRYRLIEASIYVATIALQRGTGLVLPELNALFYGHWWALTIIGASWLYPQRTKVRLVAGLAIMSVFSAYYALNEGGWYQLLFLVEHIALLTFGALRAKSWALWWGLVGSVLAVVYFLGGLNFLTLAFLGLLMIGIVVRRLLKGSSSADS